MKYITLFETSAAYNAATLDLPNVSLIEENMSVSYNPYVELETRVVAKYNVTSTSSPTALRTNNEQNIFKSMEIDDVMLDNLVTGYTFNTTGIHTVKYELYDETKLGNNAPVFNSSNLIECIIPNSVTNIGNSAFAMCAGLTSIKIPNSVTNIGNSAFTNCSSLTSIEIPNSVTSIAYNAFQACKGLTSIYIPSSVISIGSNVFQGCSNLTSININNSNTAYDSRNNCNAIINTETNTLIQGCKTTIIPNSVTSIGNNAFDSCIGLTSIDIPDSVTSIGKNAFVNCSGLASINIPSSVTTIGDAAFGGCNSLISINVNNSNTTYDSRNNCNAIIATSTNILIAGCKNTVIPNSVTSIGSSAFQSCIHLTSIYIPDSVTNIGSYAFQGCGDLTSLVIGSGVTSIGRSAFINCSKLINITSNATTAPTIQSTTFQSVKKGGTLTVPVSSTGYDVWMGTGNYYLGKYNWTKVEQ